MKRWSLWMIVGLVAAPGTSAAHVGLMQPLSRYGQNVLKSPPCGLAGGGRSQNVYTFRPGETITLMWDEYIDHPGHFRIAFDADGDDDFVDPPCEADCDTTNPKVTLYVNDAVLMDGIADTQGDITAIEVTLPRVQCDNCTLQVLQVMYDKPPYEIPGNEMYYQCVDLVLAGDPVNDGGVDAGFGPGGDGGPPGLAAAGGVNGGCRCKRYDSRERAALWLLVLGWLGWRGSRPKRRR